MTARHAKPRELTLTVGIRRVTLAMAAVATVVTLTVMAL